MPTGAGDSLTIASGIVEAVDQGAKVINLSLGSEYSSDIIAAAVGYAIDSGVTVIAAGGNEYAEGNPVDYPAALPGVIGVSSVNRDGQSSVFANSGSYIDIAAPGEDILSTVPGGGWDYMDGTSMAAPFVSATAALVRVANPTLTKAQVDTTLLSTARDDADGDGRDNWFGYGILQADQAALTAAQAPGGIRMPLTPASAAPVKVKASQRQVRAARGREPEQGQGLLDLPGRQAARRRDLEAAEDVQDPGLARRPAPSTCPRAPTGSSSTPSTATPQQRPRPRT